jgi:hypothetical protein
MWRPTISSDVIYHSAKGSTWKKHKYLKKIGNAYVYAKAAYNADRKYKKASERSTDLARMSAHSKRNADAIRRDSNREANIWNEASDRERRKAATQYQNSVMYYNAKDSYKKLAKGQLKSLGNEISSDIANSINKGKKMVNNWLEKRKRKKRAKKTAAAAQAKGKNRTWNETARHGKSITEKKIREKRITEKRR